MHVSLKGRVKPKELIDTIAGVHKGRKKAIKKFSEYAEKGLISTTLYNKTMTEYRTNKDKKDKERSDKIKSILAIIVLMASMVITLGVIASRDGNGAAFWYLILYFWAIDYAFAKDSKSKQISKLERENEILKESLENAKKDNKKLETELEDIRNNSQCVQLELPL